ncbi:MAG TPA: PilN domain-containing protein [Burkholderiaceae bacterium]|nr:PilN domain-containing protein [Burkholderiaceae bacterium]
MSSRAASTKVGLAPATEIGDPLSRRLSPIRINLLPHREMRRERRKKDFVGLAVLVAIAGAAVTFAGGVAINQSIATQLARNDFIRAENARLDAQIAEIKTLREEIAALRARQEAVENLQSDRTVPVRLFDELVRLAPEGLYLRGLKQDDNKVALTGHAQTNERVAELLRNLAERSPWIERPELGEIKEVALPGQAGREGRRIYEFSLNALIKRPSAEGARPGAGTAPRTDAATAPRAQADTAATGAR